jgi:hypothetical protein
MLTQQGGLMPHIYKITNIINNKSYIGKTEKSNPEERFKEHIKDSKRNYKNKRPLYEAFKKYGIDNFLFEILEETDNANEREIYYISLYNTYKEGYNATIGGDGNSYITNQQEIVEYYLKHKPFIKELASHFNLDTRTITKILNQFEIGYDVKARHSKTILQKDKQGNLINTFNSARDAALSLGNIKLNGHINQCCNGKRKSIGGFIWEFKEL